MLSYLFKGIIIGLSIAAPVGPIGVLCIKRTLSEGMVSGFVTGLGAAAADTIYGIVAAFGITAITNALVAQQMWIHTIGGMFLLYLGFRIVTGNPANEAAKAESKSLLWNFISTFFLTLTNPTTVLSFMAVFAGIGIGTSGYMSSAIVAGGVCLGSVLWWFILSGIMSRLRSKVNDSMLIWIKRLSGMIIVGFGIWALYTAKG
ncbi:MAG TPA: LysE family translocator [Bacteroidia bacterium]|nr:LysE family translocator [Bacteroidia bacterium]